MRRASVAGWLLVGASAALWSTVVEAATPAALTISPVQATFVPDEFATHYSVTAQSANATVSYQWRLIPPAADAGCNHFSATGNTAVWHHGDQDGCNHDVQVAQGHPGTVIVVVSNGSFTCTASYFGTNTGSGPTPQCSALTQVSPSAVAKPTAAAAHPNAGIPPWQIAVAVLVFLVVAGTVGWFLLASRRDPCAGLRDRCRELQARAAAAASRAAGATAAAAAAKKACDDAKKAREKVEEQIKAASGEGGSWIEGSEHPGERLTSHDLALQAQYEASVRAQVQSGDITEAQAQEMLSHWGDPAQWQRLRKEEQDRLQSQLAAATAAESSACAEAGRLSAEASSAASAAAAAQKAADEACAAADECEKQQRDKAAAAAAAAATPPSPPPPPTTVSPPSVSQPPPPPKTQDKPECEEGTTREEVRCVTEVDMYNLAETTLEIDGTRALPISVAEKAMAGLDRGMQIIDIGTLAVGAIDSAPLALGTWIAGKFGFPSFDTITSLPQDAVLDSTRHLIDTMRNIHRAGTWVLKCNLYHLKATCTVTYTCRGGHWVVTDRKLSVEQVGGPTPRSSRPEVMVPGQGSDPNAQARMFGFYTSANRAPQQKLDECARKCQA